MNRTVHFEIHAPDANASMDFYRNALGWEFQQWGDDDYFMTKTGEQGEAGIEGAVMPSKDGQPRVVNVVAVEDVDAVAEAVGEHGGKVVVEKFAVPGVGWIIYFTDPGGVLMGAMQSDADAA